MSATVTAAASATGSHDANLVLLGDAERREIEDQKAQERSSGKVSHIQAGFAQKIGDHKRDKITSTGASKCDAPVGARQVKDPIMAARLGPPEGPDPRVSSASGADRRRQGRAWRIDYEIAPHLWRSD